MNTNPPNTNSDTGQENEQPDQSLSELMSETFQQLMQHPSASKFLLAKLIFLYSAILFSQMQIGPYPLNRQTRILHDAIRNSDKTTLGAIAHLRKIGFWDFNRTAIDSQVPFVNLPDRGTKSNPNALALAINMGDIDTAELLLRMGASPEANLEQQPPIARVITEIKDDELAKKFIDLLIEYGADINDTGLVRTAIRYDRADIYQYLVESGAAVDYNNHWKDVMVYAENPSKYPEVFKCNQKVLEDFEQHGIRDDASCERIKRIVENHKRDTVENQKYDTRYLEKLSNVIIKTRQCKPLLTPKNQEKEL